LNISITLHILGSVPSIEKHDRPKYQSRSKPRQRSQLANSVFANTEIYEEIGIDGPFIAYGSPLTIAKTNIKVIKHFVQYNC
jgi:hypothetical protein